MSYDGVSLALFFWRLLHKEDVIQVSSFRLHFVTVNSRLASRTPTTSHCTHCIVGATKASGLYFWSWSPHFIPGVTWNGVRASTDVLAMVASWPLQTAKLTMPSASLMNCVLPSRRSKWLLGTRTSCSPIFRLQVPGRPRCCH